MLSLRAEYHVFDFTWLRNGRCCRHFFSAIYNRIVLMWCVRLLHELCSPASDLSVGFHPIITGTTETEGLRLLQCHALSIDNDVSGQQSASSFRIISSKNLVLFFDCPTLKTEVLRISEASVAIYQPTQRHTAQDVNIYERTPLREIHISLNL